MQTARAIYEHYQVPPWLQLHQLRVAVVGKMVAKHLQRPADTRLIIATCLVHDVGAIVKFDFGEEEHVKLKDLRPADEMQHWVAIQQEMREKYGSKEFDASDAILKEIGAEDIRGIFKDLGLTDLRRIVQEDRIEAIAVEYADMRVGPHGVVSLEERFADVAERYAPYHEAAGTVFPIEEYRSAALALEEYLFTHLSLRPEDITDEAISSIMGELWDYQVA